MKLSRPFKETADFESFRKAATGQNQGGPVPLIELFADPEIMSEATGIEFAAEKYRELMNLSGKSTTEMMMLGLKFLELHLAFTQAVGYDYVTAFPTIPMARTPDQMRANPAQQGKVRSWQNEGQGVISSREEFRDFPWPQPEDWSIVSVLALQSKLPPGARFIHFMMGIFEELRMLMGFETFAINSLEDPELVDDILEKLAGLVAALMEKVAAHPAVGAIFYCDDMSFNNGPMVSPGWLREHIFPRQKRLVEIAHRHDKPVFFHCCGRSESFMEDLIETVGIDAYHAFQDNVVPVEEYYRRYHDRIGILGGLDVNLLSSGTPDQVRARCRQILDVCGPGGGYGMGTGNSVTNYCKVENYYAMIDETRKWNEARGWM